jgi:Uncharacterized NAD(FAD)-dependent dehydrogenases
MRVVIIGAGAAGMSSASRIKRLKPETEVIVLEETDFISHAPCGVPYYLEGLVENSKMLSMFTAEEVKSERGIEVRINHKVVDVEHGRVFVEARDSKYSLDYDYLVIATGANPKVPRMNISTDYLLVHHPAHAEEVKNYLSNKREVIIVGAGLVGVEVAEAMRAQGKRVIVLEFLGGVLRRMLDQDTSSLVENEMRRSGVELVLNEKVVEIKEESGKKVVLTEGNKYRGDAVVIAAGVEPNTWIARRLGIRIGETGAIYTDERMRTSVENVYAAGDNVETNHIVLGKRTYSPFGPVANKMGYVAGANIAGVDAKFPGVVGTAFTKYGELQIGKTGLTEDEAKAHNIKYESALIKAKTRARYYPGGKNIWVKLIVESGSKRILGAQVLGYEEVLGRVDLIAVALHKRMSVEELFYSDLAYLPAVTTVWDPVIVAARQFL